MDKISWVRFGLVCEPWVGIILSEKILNDRIQYRLLVTRIGVQHGIQLDSEWELGSDMIKMWMSYQSINFSLFFLNIQIFMGHVKWEEKKNTSVEDIQSIVEIMQYRIRKIHIWAKPRKSWIIYEFFRKTICSWGRHIIFHTGMFE